MHSFKLEHENSARQNSGSLCCYLSGISVIFLIYSYLKKIHCDTRWDSLEVITWFQKHQEVEERSITMDYLVRFCKNSFNKHLLSWQVFEFFRNRIEHQYPLDPTPEDPLEAQKTAHEVGDPKWKSDENEVTFQ